MANLIVLAGFSNSGKSTSLKYLNSEETFIISCTNKQLQIPGFRRKYKKIAIEEKKLVGNWLVSNNYEKINKILEIIDKKIEKYFATTSTRKLYSGFAEQAWSDT